MEIQLYIDLEYCHYDTHSVLWWYRYFTVRAVVKKFLPYLGPVFYYSLNIPGYAPESNIISYYVYPISYFLRSCTPDENPSRPSGSVLLGGSAVFLPLLRNLKVTDPANRAFPNGHSFGIVMKPHGPASPASDTVPRHITRCSTTPHQRKKRAVLCRAPMRTSTATRCALCWRDCRDLAHHWRRWADPWGTILLSLCWRRHRPRFLFAHSSFLFRVSTCLSTLSYAEFSFLVNEYY